MKPWQRGVPLETLKAQCELFKRIYGPHTNGAFGCAKERDIADAMARTDNYAQHGNAAAIYKRLAQTSTQHDFAGNARGVPGGDVVVHYVGWATGAQADAVALLRGLLTRVKCLWVSLPPESKAARKLASALGGIPAIHKVTAGGDVRIVYACGPAATARIAALGPLHPAEQPALLVLREDYLTLDTIRGVLGELKTAGAGWTDHYSSYNKGKTWTAVALRGYVPTDPTFIIKPSEMSKKWKAEHADLLTAEPVWTVAADKFPLTVALAKKFGTLDRVRFMKLAPGKGELTRHADITDRAAGVADGRIARLHIPLITNPGVLFWAWGLDGVKHEQHLPRGALCYLDQRKPHACCNQGDSERIHLVLDIVSTAKLRQRICAAAGLQYTDAKPANGGLLF